MSVTSILNWISLHHSTLLAIGMGALGLSVMLETLLTKFKVQSKKVAFMLLHVFTSLTSVVTLFLGASGKDTVGTYAGLTIVASFWHRFVVSSLNTKYVTPFLSWLAKQNTASPTPFVGISSAEATPPVTQK